MSLVIKPILPKFGAEISGVDITRPLDEATKREILDAQSQWGVTVWRDTHLDDASHVAFSRIFGYLEKAPSVSGRRARFSQPELFDAGNLDIEGNILRDEKILLHKKGDQLFHSDSSFMPKRTAISALLCHEAPPEGGETWFADTRTAYEDLPQRMKDKIENLEAEHSIWWSRKMAGYPFTEEDVDARGLVRQPMVLLHRGSGRKALYVGAHARDVVGMSREEGRALIAELNAFASQPKYVFSVKYKPGDMTIWDNLASMHRGGDYDAAKYRRDMRRTTVREGDPAAATDDQFADIFKRAGHSAYSPAER